MNVDYLGKEQDWVNKETIYWFRFNGIDADTGIEFDNEVFGIVEHGCDNPFVVAGDNTAIATDRRALVILKHTKITSERRCE